MAAANNVGYGILTPQERELTDATNGFHRDGRVRDPIPSKLKGKTDGRQGNFSVMHMDVTGRSEATQRDAQAKRTSESTELAAKKAYENGYVPLRRNKFVHVPEEQSAARPSQPAPDPPPAPSRPGRTEVLDPVETKAEQARLLTLLRTLHPLSVVDQICKALAFFGGIPQAPPPVDDGSFPQSAEANGSGRLFVGWIAEIFPKLAHEGQATLTPAREVETTESTKRKRGRPKGSKATKARKDKGIKKGPLKFRNAGAAQPQRPAADMSVDDSWVDVPDGEDEPDVGPQHDVRMFEPPLSQNSAPQGAPPPIRDGTSTTPARITAVPLPGQGPAAGAEATPSGKRRGRPKGSKNRPKTAVEAPNATPQASQTPQAAAQESQTPQSFPISQVGQVSQAHPAIPAHLATQSGVFTPVNSGANPALNPSSETPSKKKAGRPKGSKNKPRPSETPAAAPATAAAAAASHSQHTVNGAHLVQEVVPREVQVPASHAYQAPALTLPVAAGAAPPSQPGEQAGANKKRKRKGGKGAGPAQVVSNGSGNDVVSRASGIALPHVPSTTSQPEQRAADTGTSVAPPPAKRQKKGKEAKAAARAANKARQPDARGTEPGEISPPVQQAMSQPAAHDALSVSVDQTISSLQSPPHSHFQVPSPTMENYEAQLHAQLEREAPEPQVISPPSRVNPRQLMANHMQQHQKQQLQQRKQQHQQQQQQQQQRQRPPQQSQQPQHSKASASQSRSPRPQQQATKPQTSSPMVTQQANARAPQNTFSQYRQNNPQYGQQRQAYSPQQRQQFSQQHSPQISALAATSQEHQQQQYASAATHQQQNFSTNQHNQYTGGQSGYTGGQQQQQQQVPSQQRFQQLGTSSAGTASFAAHQSPQFGSSANNSFTTNDNTYRTSTALNNSAFATQRAAAQSAATTGANGFRAGGGSAHGLSQQHQQPSTFGATTAAAQQRSAASSSAGAGQAGGQQQQQQGVQNLQSFPGNPDWMFDPSLDASGGHNPLNLSGAYSAMGAGAAPAGGVPRAGSSNSGTAFSQSALTSFDPSGLGGNDRYYGVARR